MSCVDRLEGCSLFQPRPVPQKQQHHQTLEGMCRAVIDSTIALWVAVINAVHRTRKSSHEVPNILLAFLTFAKACIVLCPSKLHPRVTNKLLVIVVGYYCSGEGLSLIHI